MIAIENTLLSDELFTECFCCNLPSCKGCCCIEGDAGAPLEEDEIDILEQIYPLVAPEMTESGRQRIQENGFFEIALDGSLVTPLVQEADCAFLVVGNDGIAKCAIEIAYEKGKIRFPKPISCHLYPIRIQDLAQGEALNYDRWPICNKAREEGKKQGIVLYKYLRNPLVRKYGEEWYAQVEAVAKEVFRQS